MNLRPFAPLLLLVLAGCATSPPPETASVGGVSVVVLGGPAVVRTEYGTTVWSFRAENRGNLTWEYTKTCGARNPWDFVVVATDGTRWKWDSPFLAYDCAEFSIERLSPGESVSGSLPWKHEWWNEKTQGYGRVPPGEHTLVVEFHVRDDDSAQVAKASIGFRVELE